MSYDLEFTKDGNIVEFDDKHDIKGGTYALGGINTAELNITYNYGRIFGEHLGQLGIRSLYGKTAAEVIEDVGPAIEKLGTKRHRDYWADTPGNAGAALSDLREIARMCPPDAVLNGD